MLSPQELKDCQGNIIWSNQYLNSRFSNHPIVLLFQKENIESVTSLMNFLNPHIDELISTSFENESGHVNFEIKASMLDGKMSGIFSGHSGAACHCCFAGQTDVSDPENVIAGILRNWTLKAIKDTIVELTSNGKSLLLILPDNELKSLMNLQVQMKLFLLHLHSYKRILD
ncbi:hypothetical protein LOD99_7512 [Oopsacas minuta]|uniref:Uncharacterized protein n=1 Tax=Oopsacas minuta TaxID=111878 RepID=A0AAV7JU31_9METZ|nr:hypothetical protein LOD99_7512 [Oopsacas minuta]